MSLSLQLATLVSASHPTDDALTAARDGILDFVAVSFAGADDRSVAAIEQALGDTAGKSPVFGSAVRRDALSASLINGYIAHALDYDDVHSHAGGHPSAVLLPALFAAASEAPVSGRALLEAYVVGLETMTVLGRSIGRRHYSAGFHSTATLGIIAAAAAVGHLLESTPEQIANGLGIAATQSSGLRVHFGTDVKPLHAGLAARAGLFSARLSVAGLTGTEEVLDGEIGLLTLLGLGEARIATEALESFGQPWQIVSPGLKFKRYPCCAGTHRVADALLELIAEEDIDPVQVEAVEIGFFEGFDSALRHHRPRDGLEGRFSIEYVVATALLRRHLGIAEFSSAATAADVAELGSRVQRTYRPRPSDLRPDQAYETVKLRLNDGRILTREARKAANVHDLRAKFDDASGGRATLQDIPDLIALLDDRDSLLKLLDSFSRA